MEHLFGNDAIYVELQTGGCDGTCGGVCGVCSSWEDSTTGPGSMN